MPPGKGEEWAPLMTYRNALCQGDYELAMQPPSMLRGKSRAGKGAKRKLMESAHEVLDSRTPARGIPQPYTSTAVKRKREDDSEGGSEASSDFEQ